MRLAVPRMLQVKGLFLIDSSANGATMNGDGCAIPGNLI